MNSLHERIREFNKDRNPKILKYKYKFMRENLFRFYRGTCHLFYEDLAAAELLSASPPGWICGDLHLENFGSFRGSNELVYFDLNDFDEAVLAPVTWEVVRFVTSIFVGFESLGIDERKAEKMASLYLKAYTETLRCGKPDYIEPITADGIVRDFLKAADRRRQKDILTKRTFFSKKDRKILLDNPKHLRVKDDLKRDLLVHLDTWLKNDENSPYNYRAIDVIFRVAGTGSVGINRFTFLLKTLNKTGDKYFLLDMKEAVRSSLTPFLDIKQPSWASEAERVVTIQKKMQNRNPALLSTSTFRGKSYIMQEMQPTKDSIDFNLLKKRYREMYRVIYSMAVLTASSQLRSSGQLGSATTDDLSEFANKDGWQPEVIAYAIKYSDTIKQYYKEFLDSFTTKEIVVPPQQEEVVSEEAASG
jgi:uncharacterized protein (DUF2252 family)